MTVRAESYSPGYLQVIHRMSTTGWEVDCTAFAPTDTWHGRAPSMTTKTCPI